jgi:glyoxylase-like metal-dependent hydrolase (beta-lactamase superfamily II)
MGIDIKCYPKGLYGENTYLISDQATRLKAVIDPGYYGNDVAEDIKNADSLKYLLLTHGHHDHYLAVSQYLNEYSDAKFAAPESERFLIEKADCPVPDIWLSDGESFTLGETEFRVIATPGHTEGGICFMTDSEIFTGDTLFRLSVGRTDLETGDWFTLLHSISERLYTLNENLTVYPGHGAASTIGYEKRANPFV